MRNSNSNDLQQTAKEIFNSLNQPKETSSIEERIMKEISMDEYLSTTAITETSTVEVV